MQTALIFWYIVILLIGFVALLGYTVYFVFKIHQFVIQAVNLYKDMVTRQDMMIKLLEDIRGKRSGSNDARIKKEDDNAHNEVDLVKLEEQRKLDPEKIFLEDKKVFMSGKCPKCGTDVYNDIARCLVCGLDFSNFIG